MLIYFGLLELLDCLQWFSHFHPISLVPQCKALLNQPAESIPTITASFITDAARRSPGLFTLNIALLWLALPTLHSTLAMQQATHYFLATWSPKTSFGHLQCLRASCFSFCFCPRSIRLSGYMLGLLAWVVVPLHWNIHFGLPDFHNLSYLLLISIQWEHFLSLVALSG